MLTETKAKVDDANTIMIQFNFLHSTNVDADGLLGGIYVLWNDQTNIQQVALTPQEIYLFVKLPIPPFSFYLTGVYSKPYPSFKHTLWENL